MIQRRGPVHLHVVLQNRAYRAICDSTGSLISDWYDAEDDLNIWDNDFVPGDPPNISAAFRNPLPIPYPKAWISRGIVLPHLRSLPT